MYLFSLCRRFFGILAFTLLLGVEARSQELVISELMAAGQSVIADEEGAFRDWIEIHNSGDASAQLAGWRLSDAPDAPGKWSFPARTLAAGERVVVFASGRNRAPAEGPLHTNFSLKSGGEYLALIRPDGSVAQAVTYPLQLPDISYDPVTQQLFATPTPGAPNTTEPLAIATAPTFSTPHGFYDAPFSLTLETPTSGASIRFTTDGTEPTESRGTVYTAPIQVAKTSVIRAAAFAAGSQPSPVATRTYLFVDDIVEQSLNGKAPPDWPKKWGMHRVDYGVDPRITKRGPYATTIRDDLRTIPSLSIVMDLEELFDSTTGIYANPQEKGREWERPMSLELIEPLGTGGFQVNAGLRIRGGASRDSANPKHSFRVLFRKEYGAAELKYPLFGQEGARSTARFDIRCEQLVAWHYFVDREADFIRDIFGRDTQGALGQPFKRGDFQHLYINGQYWGLYQTDERVTGHWGAEYFGGDEEDYDVVKFDAESGYGTGFTDGTLGAWRRLYDVGVKGFADNVDYWKVQGLNPDGSRNRDFERLLDVDNLIDYMLAGIFIAADDSPPAFGTSNNWYGMRSRKDDFGFRFFAHDWEISMRDHMEDRVGPHPDEGPFDEFQGPESVNPWHYWQALRVNPEFRLRVADHVQRHFFEGGPLTVEAAKARWQRRMDEIDRAIVGESARWGDARREGIQTWKGAEEFAAAWRGGQQPALEGAADRVVIDPGPGPRPGPKPGPGRPAKKPKPFTREDWFAAANGRVLEGFLTGRSAAMLQHLRGGRLFPETPAPAVQPHGGALPPDGRVTLSASGAAGTGIYYTIDGSDPRRIGGEVAPSARLYAAPFPLVKSGFVKARARVGDEWSPLAEVEFTPGVDYRELRLTEILYRPAGSGAMAGDAEFLELKNTGNVPLDLSGARFTAGVDFTFPNGTAIPAGEFFLLARSAGAFAAHHPGLAPDGIYSGRLSDDGETLTLTTATGARIFSQDYDDETPWPLAADGLGFSLVRANDRDPDRPTSWRASAVAGGSPRADDSAPATFPSVVVNEVLARPSTGEQKAIELANMGSTVADISGWWLSDDLAEPRKFRIPAGTVLQPGEYAVFTAAQFGSGALAFDLPAIGGAVWLFSTDAADALSGYVHGFTFGGSREGVSFGRYVNSAGDERFPALELVGFGGGNQLPRASAVRINELQYFPVPGGDEFVELENRTDAEVSLAGGAISGFGYTFPSGATIAPLGRVLVVAIDPALFRTKHGVPAEVQIFGTASGVLQDDGERVELRLPIIIGGVAASYVEDSVRYDDERPWATGAAGFGASLQRIRSASYADEPLNWIAGPPTIGTANTVNAPPRVQLTSPLDGATVLPPRRVTFVAEASDADGSVARVEFLVDNVVVGESSADPYVFEWRPTPGLHDLSARAIDNEGVSGESDFATIDVDAPGFGSGLGLRGEYFSNLDFSGTPTVRDDPRIQFDWAERSPLPELPREGYSVRWSGKLLPRLSGEHVISVYASGGVRVFINGEMLVDQWDEPTGSDLARIDAPVTLVAGEIADLRLEYAERDGFGSIELLWVEPGNFDAEPLLQNDLYLPDQDPDALGIATPAELPARRLGRLFRTQLQALNGRALYVWTVAGGTLPPGVELTPSGVLTGSPTVAGVFHFTVRVKGGDAATAEKQFTLRTTDEVPRPLRPRVEIATPAEGAAFGRGPITFTGTASVPSGLAELRYSVNDGPWHYFPGGAKWRLTLDSVRGLQPGRNQVRFAAFDLDGRESEPAIRTVQRTVRGPLIVRVEGPGTVTPSFLGQTERVLGQDYTIIAKPKPGFVLQEWRTDFGSSRALYFTMSEGLEITAVFVPNPFRELGGSYVALLTREPEAHKTRGSVTFAVTPVGAFTGTLYFGGERHRLRGVLDVNGSTFLGVLAARRFLNMDLQMDFASGEIEVRVGFSEDEDYVESVGIATRAGFDPTTAPSSFTHLYEVTFASEEPSASPAAAPVELPSEGNGRAALRILADGRSRLVGRLIDGTLLSIAGLQRKDGGLILYAPLYKGAGSLSGMLQFPDPLNRLRSGSFFWSKPAPEGTDAVLDVLATPFPPPSERIRDLHERR